MLAQLNGRAAEILMQRFACYTDLHVGQNCTRYVPVSLGYGEAEEEGEAEWMTLY